MAQRQFDCADVCSARYRLCVPSLLWFANNAAEPAMQECAIMISEGRLLWLSGVEWSLLLVSAALCGYLALLV